MLLPLLPKTIYCRLSPRASLSTRGKYSLVKPFRHLEASFLSSLHCCCCPKSLVSCKASTSRKSLRSLSAKASSEKKPSQLTHKTGRSCQNVEDMTFLEFLESWLWLFFYTHLHGEGKKRGSNCNYHKSSGTRLLLLLSSRKLLLQSGENLMTVVISIDSSNKHICCCFYTIRVIVVAQIDVIFVTNLFSSTLWLYCCLWAIRSG